ncbi:hypothetical protein [uncultured Microbulbifer sp.]|uniref:hypothetical protein n=1 Tax=uncultured Microbulbifer sp. TaxID=348147 RepID=UPI00261EB7B4|nr:hypothetical protein [uncultured Microbulbifer sp.]
MKLLWFLGMPYYVFITLALGKAAKGSLWYFLLLIPLLLAYGKLSQSAYTSMVLRRGVSKVTFGVYLVLAQILLGAVPVWM